MSSPQRRPQYGTGDRKHAASFHAEPWHADTLSEPTASAPASSVVSSPSQSKVISVDSDVGLNEEVAAMRVAIARLAAETRGIVEARSDPPPAYN